MTDSLSQLVVDANEVLELKLVRSVDDLEDDEAVFLPEMSHQVFGENENIFGYTDLRIRLYYSAASLQTFLGMDYEEKIDPKLKAYHGMQPDDVLGKISKVLAPNFMTNIDEFAKALSNDDKFVPYGSLKRSFNAQKDESPNVERTFEVYFCDVHTSGFVQFHQRLQTFLLWYVDAASFIDIDDDQWNFFVVFEKYATSEGGHRYAVVGYATVYRYYAYPRHIRPRISQVLILPPFRRLGICAHLVQAINNHFVNMSDVRDVTVEDPSEEFQRVRDFVDASRCRHLPAFTKEKLSEGFSPEMASQACNKFKMNKKQSRRVYEILRLMNTNRSNTSEYQAYRLDVKNRLNAPFQKKKQEIKKLQKVLKPEEYATAAVALDHGHERLTSQYQHLEEEYNKIIDRINNHSKY